MVATIKISITKYTRINSVTKTKDSANIISEARSSISSTRKIRTSINRTSSLGRTVNSINKTNCLDRTVNSPNITNSLYRTVNSTKGTNSLNKAVNSTNRTNSLDRTVNSVNKMDHLVLIINSSSSKTKMDKDKTSRHSNCKGLLKGGSCCSVTLVLIQCTKFACKFAKLRALEKNQSAGSGPGPEEMMPVLGG
ncbi:unnamed protein product [Meganyctiphanes norvegica]|uniref:Uncharacterized protein n=1 Tax=Meganyctiphanes norvegica TaxID=48144 RepID=A0AAV2SL15_MEGNR